MVGSDDLYEKIEVIEVDEPLKSHCLIISDKYESGVIEICNLNFEGDIEETIIDWANSRGYGGAVSTLELANEYQDKEIAWEIWPSSSDYPICINVAQVEGI